MDSLASYLKTSNILTEVPVLSFSYVAFFKAYCSRVAKLQWRHFALNVIDGAFMLVSRHLSFG